MARCTVCNIAIESGSLCSNCAPSRQREQKDPKINRALLCSCGQKGIEINDDYHKITGTLCFDCYEKAMKDLTKSKYGPMRDVREPEQKEIDAIHRDYRYKKMFYGEVVDETLIDELVHPLVMKLLKKYKERLQTNQ